MINLIKYLYKFEVAVRICTNIKISADIQKDIVVISLNTIRNCVTMPSARNNFLPQLPNYWVKRLGVNHHTVAQFQVHEVAVEGNHFDDLIAA